VDEAHESEQRTAPLANRVVTNVVMPIAAFVSIFLGVAAIGVFALLLHPDTSIAGPGGSLAPWAFALAGSIGIFAGCNYVFMWRRERERVGRVGE